MNNLFVDLLNRSLAPLRYIVVDDDPKRVTNVVVQLRNPPHPIYRRLVTLLDVSQNLEH
jgi:hypothetical protein